jgi:uncharacterized RmlC-like cupin family protein
MEQQTAPTCVRIEHSPEYRGKQGLEYFAGVSAQTTGSHGDNSTHGARQAAPA